VSGTADGASLRRWTVCDGCGDQSSKARKDGWMQFREIGILMANLCPACYQACIEWVGKPDANPDFATAVRDCIHHLKHHSDGRKNPRKETTQCEHQEPDAQ